VTNATTSPTDTAFRPDVEGLRGVAILLVVAYHAQVPGFPGGYVGVDLFFVLSGYLITRLLVTEFGHRGRIDFLHFYARRIRRLLPAAVLVVVATLLIGLLVYPPADQLRLAASALATVLYVSNIHFADRATDYLADEEANPLLHTWSLAVEEQFYLLWPAIIAAALIAARRRPGSRRLVWTVAAIGAGSFLLSVWLTEVVRPWAFFLLPTRAWEFALGALASLLPIADRLEVRWVRGLAWTGLALVLGAAVGFGPETGFPGAAALIPTAGTACLLVAGATTVRGGPFPLLEHPAMQWLGRLSYAWYLWHWPLLAFARDLPLLDGPTVFLALSVVALGLAAVTHRLVENPVRRSPWLQARPRLALAMALLLTTAGVSAAVLTRAFGERESSSPSQVAYSEARARPRPYTDGCHLSLFEVTPRLCTYGDTTSPATVVLFGDSHATHWFPALESAAWARRFRLVSMSKSACPAASVRLANEQLGRGYVECDRWRERALRQIVALRPAVVVISSFSAYLALPGERNPWRVGLATWKVGLQRTVARLDAAGIRVVVLSDVPRAPYNIPSCLARAAWNPFLYRDDCDFPRASERIELAHKMDLEVATLVPSTRVLDLTDVICPTETCDPEEDGMVRYRDSHHLTTRYSASLADILASRLLPAGATGTSVSLTTRGASRLTPPGSPRSGPRWRRGGPGGSSRGAPPRPSPPT
jgi:peptidoglycan/LPS O-acetylase OafA/YrhL